MSDSSTGRKTTPVTTTEPTAFELSELRFLPENPDSDIPLNKSEIKEVITALAKSYGKIGSFSKPQRALAGRLAFLMYGENVPHERETRAMEIARAMAERGLIRAVINTEGRLVQISFLQNDDEISDEDDTPDETAMPEYVNHLLESLTIMAERAAGKGDDEVLAFADEQIALAEVARDSAMRRADELAETIRQLKSQQTDEELRIKAAELEATIQQLQRDVQMLQSQNGHQKDEIAQLLRKVEDLRTNNKQTTKSLRDANAIIGRIRQDFKVPKKAPDTEITDSIDKVIEYMREGAVAEELHVVIGLLNDINSFDAANLLYAFSFEDGEQADELRELSQRVRHLETTIENMSEKGDGRKRNRTIAEYELARKHLRELSREVIQKQHSNHVAQEIEFLTGIRQP